MKVLAKIVLLSLALTISSFGQSDRFRVLLDQARRGDVDAKNSVGIAYFEGNGVKASRTRAVYGSDEVPRPATQLEPAIWHFIIFVAGEFARIKRWR